MRNALFCLHLLIVFLPYAEAHQSRYLRVITGDQQLLYSSWTDAFKTSYTLLPKKNDRRICIVLLENTSHCAYVGTLPFQSPDGQRPTLSWRSQTATLQPSLMSAHHFQPHTTAGPVTASNLFLSLLRDATHLEKQSRGIFWRSKSCHGFLSQTGVRQQTGVSHTTKPFSGITAMSKNPATMKLSGTTLCISLVKQSS